MKKLIFAFLILAFCAVSGVSSAQETPALKVKVSVSPGMKSSFIKGGRIILYLTRQKSKVRCKNLVYSDGRSLSGMER